MRVDWAWLILIILALGVLVMAILRNEIFPNPFLTWSLRIIVIFIIIAVIGIYRRKKLKNL